MKIAFYCPMKPMSHGNPSGDRQLARELFGYLRSRGGEVFVLSEFRSLWFFRSLGMWRQFFVEFLAAYRKCKTECPDLFLVYHLYYKAPDPIAILLALWFRKPYVVFEGMYSRKAARRGLNWIGYCFTKVALTYARVIFSNKVEDLEFLKKWFPAEKILFIPPSLNLESFPLSAKVEPKNSSKPLIISVAMLRPDRKSEGIEFQLSCLKRLKEKGEQFRWLHVGGGSEYLRLKGLARSQLGDSAEFVGTVEHQKVVEYLGRADIFAFPGIDEAFGLVYLEAQAMGLPVVAFENGGVPQAVGLGGRLTKPFDSDEYEGALVELLEDERLRQRMGMLGRQWVEEKFDRKENLKALWRALEALTA